MRFFSKIDLFKTIPKDLTQATFSGVICFLNSIYFMIINIILFNISLN